MLALLPDSDITGAAKALAFRVASTLSQDYFLEAQIKFGEISHGLPVLVTKQKSPIEIVLDPSGATVRIILELYDNEYLAFGHMTKDFVRNMIFPRVSDLVPSATRQGAEAFLKSIYRPREVFEVEVSDLESLTSLWQDYLSGKLTFQQATERSNKVAQRSYQVVDRAAAGAVRDIVPDVIANEAATASGAEPDHRALPPIQRLDITTEKKVLTIEVPIPTCGHLSTGVIRHIQIYQPLHDQFEQIGPRQVGAILLVSRVQPAPKILRPNTISRNAIAGANTRAQITGNSLGSNS